MALFALKKEAVLYYMSHFTARGEKMIFSQSSFWRGNDSVSSISDRGIMRMFNRNRMIFNGSSFQRRGAGTQSNAEKKWIVVNKNGNDNFSVGVNLHPLGVDDKVLKKRR